MPAFSSGLNRFDHAVGRKLDDPLVPFLEHRVISFSVFKHLCGSVHPVGFQSVPVHERNGDKRVFPDIGDGLSHHVIDQIDKISLGTKEEFRNRVRPAVP